MVERDPYLRLRPEPPTAADELCGCKQLTVLLLQPHLTPNPLACGRCHGEVPPERIALDASLADALASWRSFHDAFYTLWLDSQEFEDWAAAQLRDPSSPVNVRGLDLARRMSCYLSWFQDEAEPDWTPATNCPRCSAKLDVLVPGEDQAQSELRGCDSCRIAITAD